MVMVRTGLNQGSPYIEIKTWPRNLKIDWPGGGGMGFRGSDAEPGAI